MGSGASTPKEKPTLYIFPLSGPCRAVLMTAKAVDLELNTPVVDLMKGEQNKEKFLKINPEHTVPTLVEGDFKLWESRAIMTYLVDKYRPDHQLYPRDPAKRAAINRMLLYDNSTASQAILNYVRPQLMGRELDNKEEKAAAVEEALNYLEKSLKKQAYMAATHLTLADLSIEAGVSMLETVKWSFQKWPKLSAWRSTIAKEPWYAEANKGLRDFLKHAASQAPPAAAAEDKDDKPSD